MPLPPGPPADPVIGHFRVFPDANISAEVFHDWMQKYGDVISLKMFGQTFVILGSEKAALEILDKRSAQYSNRPPFPLFNRTGWKGGLLFVDYGRECVQQRKLLHTPLAKQTIPTYRDIHEQETNSLLKGLLDTPHNFDRLLHRYSAAVLIDMTYGHQVRSFGDEYYEMAEVAEHMINTAIRPSLLDISPWFEYIPAWFPGAWFVRYIEEATPTIVNLHNEPFKKAQDEMAAGVLRPSFVSRNLEAIASRGGYAEELRVLKMAALQMCMGGTDTTWNTLAIFISCMLLNPHVQARAQAEIDRVIGRNRLPDLSDQDALPYVQCIMHETMRYQPVVPQGIPHKSTSDDYYEGMFIPKGAIIFASPRSITWDEQNHHEPRVFKPERFLPKPDGAGEKFSVNAVFGWGRRICPGRHLADASIWLAIARILAVFNISPTKDAEGRVIEPKIKYITGLTRHPELFLCDIHPRDDRAAVLIQDTSLASENF